MEPFENGWAKCRGHGSTYGVSYPHLYDDDLKSMFKAGVNNSSNKMSAEKIRENLPDIYLDRFPIPGEIDIKQFIGKLSQQHKKGNKNKSSTIKSTRGRKAGNKTTSWYGTLREIINNNLNEKPEAIFKVLIETFDGDSQDDLPMDDNELDKKRIKSTIARFKTDKKKSA